MIPEQTLVQFPDFADNGTKIKPEDEKYAAGFVPSDVLPAQWLNYFFNKASAGQTVINAGLASIEAELNNLLTEAGITPAAATNDQIKTAIYTMIQNKTGVLSQLTTTAKNNLVAALNEVKAGLGAAAAKGVDTEITSESSTNLPTTQAVSNQLNGALTDLTTYSTEEKVVGTWIDEKPLYQQVLSVSANETFTIANCDEVTYCWWKQKYSNGEELYNYGANGDVRSDIMRLTNGSFKALCSGGFSNSYKLTVVIQYTKTTD